MGTRLFLNDPLLATDNGRTRNMCLRRLHWFVTISFHSLHVSNTYLRREPGLCSSEW